MRVAGLLGLLALCACSDPDEATPTPVPQAASPLCASGPCDASSDCPANEACHAGLGRCLRLRCGGVGEPCGVALGDSLCEPGLGCHDGVCAVGASRACGVGQWLGEAGCVTDPCPGTTSCRVFGKCTSLQGFCMAWDSADCEASEGCVQWGECVAGDLPWDDAPTPLPRHRTCWPEAPCDVELGSEKVNACADVGLCVEEAGRCLAKTAARCVESEACTTTGACDVKDGECWRAVTSDAECAQGGENEDVCASFGFCQLRGGACVAGSDEHCRGSFLCDAYGECLAHDGECWAAPFLTPDG